MHRSFAYQDPLPSRVDNGVRRRLLHRGSTLLVEDSALAADRALGSGQADCHQIAIPYHGAFTWQVGRQRRIIDANLVLFIRTGEDFHETHPIAGIGHGSLIITPGECLLEELGGQPADMTRPLPDAARLSVHRLLSGRTTGPLEREERVIDLMTRTHGARHGRRSSPPRAVVERAKAVLHARHHPPLSLEAAARAVGVSPTYLTQAFARAEGMPLYKYQTRLRLARALERLPHCEDLTDLALELGFSSHSHFTAVFRRAFGVTPSRVREELRPRRPH